MLFAVANACNERMACLDPSKSKSCECEWILPVEQCSSTLIMLLKQGSQSLNAEFIILCWQPTSVEMTAASWPVPSIAREPGHRCP